MGVWVAALAADVPAALAQRELGERDPREADRQVESDRDVVVVEADGEGLSKEEALKVALRAALEKGGKNEIFSDTQVRNYELMHDTIISRAQGIVTDFEILREQRGVGGTFKVWIRAKVAKSVLAESWGELQNVLNQMGRPKIMVAIAERIDGGLEDESLLGSRIEEALLKSGFDVVSASGAAAAREKELSAAAAAGDEAKMRAYAREFEAQIYVTGVANANRAGIERLYDVPVAFYNCDVQARAYYTDTGKLLASRAIPLERGGARGRSEFSPQAGKMAISNVSDALVDEIYDQILEQWATAISAGGEVTLEISGVNFKAANSIKKLLAEMEGVQHVNMSLTDGIATYRINATLSAEGIAERISEGAFEGLLEVVDLKLNRIQGKGRAG
jgi:hypothetical protein